MARIAFGVMGDARGHLVRALALARELEDHEFLFLGGGRTLEAREAAYRVEELPMLATYYRNNRVDLYSTVANGLKLLVNKRLIDGVSDRLKDFQPHLVITDYEFFIARAASRLGLPCVSIDNQHVLTKCAWRRQRGQLVGRLLLSASLRCLYSFADLYFITSFFRLPILDPRDTELFPPVLGSDVRKYNSSEGDHILVYQTTPTFVNLLNAAEKLSQRCIIYGFQESRSTGKLVFKAPSRAGFLSDLASCRYAILNGGHNVISEALYYGKPVFAFPIHLAYEQFINGFMLRSLGYGDYSLQTKPDPRLFEGFEDRLGEFKARIEQESFYGNEELSQRIRDIITRV